MEVSPNTTANQYKNDEIDLFELVEGLWRERILILIITLVTLSAGVLFTFSQTPVYIAILNLTTPDPASLAPLTRLPLYDQISSQPPLSDFVTELQSSSVRNDFIEHAAQDIRNNLYRSDSEIKRLKSLDKRIKITQLDGKKSNGLYPWSIEFSADDPTVAAMELNRLSETASRSLTQRYKQRYQEAAASSLEHLNNQIALETNQLKTERLNEITRLEEAHQLQVKELEDQLIAAQQLYRTQLEDQVHMLEEAYGTAKALGITEPSRSTSQVSDSTNRVEVQLSNNNDPLYFRGTRLLSEELIQLKTRSSDFFPNNQVRQLETEIAQKKNNRKIEILKQRVSDVPFSDEIESLQKRVAEINAGEFPETLRLEFSRTSAIANPNAVKPKKVLVLALSIILGGMLGIFTALTRQAVKKRYKSATLNG